MYSNPIYKYLLSDLYLVRTRNWVANITILNKVNDNSTIGCV